MFEIQNGLDSIPPSEGSFFHAFLRVEFLLVQQLSEFRLVCWQVNFLSWLQFSFYGELHSVKWFLPFKSFFFTICIFHILSLWTVGYIWVFLDIKIRRARYHRIQCSTSDNVSLYVCPTQICIGCSTQFLLAALKNQGNEVSDKYFLNRSKVTFYINLNKSTSD